MAEAKMQTWIEQEHTFLLQNIITISFKTYRRCLYRNKKIFYSHQWRWADDRQSWAKAATEVRLVELGAEKKSSMDCRVTLPTRGEDLTFSHTTSKEDPLVKLGPVMSKCSFEILEPSKGSTKEGVFTCSAR